MLKIKPRLTYGGLTIIMSNPSRFDRAELLSATGGYFFRNECLMPHTNVMKCEVRVKEDKTPFLPGTKAILLLGLDAVKAWTNDKDHTLGEIRGSIFDINGIAAIPSYLPQDCVDVKDYESEHNILLAAKSCEEPSAEAMLKGAVAEKRRHGVTARSNWAFWLKQDTAKAMRIIESDGKVPASPVEPDYRIYPNSQTVIEQLTTCKNKNFYIDIETDENFAIQCFSFCFDDGPIYCVPLLNYDYQRAYGDTTKILRSVAVALRDNTVVSHNGAGFDWLVLSWRYHLPLGWRFYDTMLAMHRVYPDIEKSLGHGTSLWTYEPFHKDEGQGGYSNLAQMNQRLLYCGKDVHTMRLIKLAIDKFAKTVPGLSDSIQQVNDSIRAYLIMMLTGIHYKQEMLDATMRENDRLMMQYNRIINILVGDMAMGILNRKSKKSLATSNSKCCLYFHDLLGYPVVARSPKTGAPSLAKKALYKLRLKHDNPVIDFCLNYRELARESGSLKFAPWK